MAKRQRAEQLLNDPQRRTILMMADSYGLDAIAERFSLSIGEAKDAVRSCREWARSHQKGTAPVDWDAAYRRWIADEVASQIG